MQMGEGGYIHPTERNTEELSYIRGQWIFVKNSTIYYRVLHGQEPCLTHGCISRTNNNAQNIINLNTCLFIEWKD